MLLVFETRKEAGLAESIALDKFHIRQKLSRPMNKFRGHWRTAIRQNLNAAHVIRLSFWYLRQQVQHRRDEHRVSYAFTLNQLTETLRAKPWNRDLGRTESRCRKDGGKIGNVKNRRRMQIDTSFSVSHPIAEVVEVRQDVGVSHHDALRPARRTTRIDESQNRFRVINRVWTGAVPNVQGLFIEHELPRKLDAGFRERGMPHQPTRFCIMQNLIDFGGGEPCVYWNGGNSQPAAGIDQLDVLRSIGEQESKAIARS